MIEKDILKLCRLKKIRLVFIESCTGGLVSARLTSCPGASESLIGSIVVYRPEAKQNWLGLKKRVLDVHTDVSEETSIALAKLGLKKTPQAQASFSITGHLGPHAPRERDGLLFIAGALKRSRRLHIESLTLKLPRTTRRGRQWLASQAVLSMVRSLLKSNF